MVDIRSGTCPMCAHNEVVRAEPAHLNTWDAMFKLTLYFCRRCGRSETFVNDPERVPIGPVTQLISGPKPQGPYR